MSPPPPRLHPAPLPAPTTSTSPTSPTGPPWESAIDIFHSSAPLLYGPDATQTSHGNAGETLHYHCGFLPSSTPLSLTLADPSTDTHRQLFAHYIWTAALVLAELVETRVWRLDGIGVGEEEEEEKDGEGGAGAGAGGWNVIELGAGSGLCGLVAAAAAGAAGAADAHPACRRMVLLTDYPAEEVLGVLKGNVERNERVLRGMGLGRVEVQGHRWGCLDDDDEECWTREMKGAFDRVMAADCLWLQGEHGNLLASMKWFLRRPLNNRLDGGGGGGGRVWVTAGFHTGREKVGRFFDLVEDEEDGLMIERIWERDIDGNERGWERVRKDEDLASRKRWVVCAVLKWRDRNGNRPR